MQQDPIISLLLSHLLPKVVSENFELVNITDEPMEGSPVVHLHLEEKNTPPDGYPDTLPNGFYEASVVGDFPLRDKAVMLHLKRRRWKDSEGKSVPSRTYQLAADGTRLSCEFADFLKSQPPFRWNEIKNNIAGYIEDVLGLEPDNDSVAR